MGLGTRLPFSVAWGRRYLQCKRALRSATLPTRLFLWFVTHYPFDAKFIIQHSKVCAPKHIH